MDKNILWVEKYRPKTVKECILPDSLKNIFQEFVNNNEVPNMILTGTAGVGKTTVAKALCEETGLDYIMINGSDESGIDTLRVKIKGFAAAVSLYDSRKAVIIDEADYLTPAAQAAFRGVIEEFAGNCSFIFTCNFVNRLIEPLHSRCSIIDFKVPAEHKAAMAEAFFKRMNGILKTENVKQEPGVLAQLVLRFFPDYRRIINEIQKYSVGGNLDNGILAQISEIPLTQLVNHLKTKNFKEVRKWVALNSDRDPHKLLRKIYDKLNDILKPESVPTAIVLLSKYQYQSAFAADQEINTMAFVIELMLEAEFK